MMTQATRILVTGGRGYVGAALAQEIKNRDIEYLSVDKSVASRGAEEICADLRDRTSTIELIRSFKPDLLVHCATHSALVYRDRLVESFRDDAAVASNILEALSDSSGCRLVAFSSSYCYSGVSSRLPVAEEEAPARPFHNFGAAKLFFEQLMTRAHPNTLIFRLSSVFGPGTAPYPNAILTMAKECVETGRLTVWGAGARMMQYIDIADAVRYILGASAVAPGVYNLGGDEYISVAETARAIADSFGVELAFLKDKKEGETLPPMNTARLKHAFGNQMTPFPISLRAYLEFLQNARSVPAL